MGQREWAEAEYSRIYWTIVDDPKFAEVFDDDRRWAAYTRLLMLAEQAYPSAAPLPRWLSDDVLAYLCEVRIIEVVRGASYRIVGLQTEREGRAMGRAVGGIVRATHAERNELGHFLPTHGASSNVSSKSDAGSSNEVQQTQQQPANGPATAQQILLDQQGTDPASPAKTRIDEDRRDENLSTRGRTGGRSDRPDVQALRDRGWKRVTAKQRAVLDEVLVRHDTTGPAFAAEVIRATPRDKDPLTAVMAADRMWQASQRARVVAEATAEAKAKAEREPHVERNGSTASVADVLAGPSWMTPAPTEAKP